MTGWTEVTRKKRRKTVQIFVKVDGSKVTPMEVSLTDDKVEDNLRQVQNDEDVYVTMHGRMLKKSERLRSYGVTDGCTIQVTNRKRGGGRHKDKKKGSEKKHAVSAKGSKLKSVEEPKSDEGPALIQMDEVLRRMEENEEFQKIIDWVSEGSEGEVQQKVRSYLATIRISWMSKEQFEHLEGGVWRAVEARRKERGGERWQEKQDEGRREEQEQRRQEEQEQIPGQEQGKKVRFGEEEPLEKTRAESTDEPEVLGRLAEVRTGRGNRGLVRGGDEYRTDESSRKGKGKGNGRKGEHESKGRAGSKGTQQVENLAMDEDQEAEEEERGRVAPNMWAGGSHPQATSDPGKKKKDTRVLRWADCNDEEVKENEEEVEEEKETGQREMTDERPPGLEEVESELKTQQEKDPSQVEREQEVREEERRTQEAREQRRAQEAREDEERRAHEAREEERRAQEGREQKRAHEAREDEERRAHGVRKEKRCRKHERKKRRLRRSEKDWRERPRLRRSEKEK